MVALNALTSVTTYLLYFFFSNPQSHLCTSDQRGGFCPDLYSPVCALVRGKDPNSALNSYNYYQKTLSNGCTACSDETVLGYVPGECPNTDTQICSKVLRNGICTEEYDPVCTISEKRDRRRPYTKRVSAQTSANGCIACGPTASKFHVAGECPAVENPQICKKSDRKAAICSSDYTPVCAYYTKGGCKEQLCRKTQSNYCVGCLDSRVVFVVDGECPAA